MSEEIIKLLNYLNDFCKDPFAYNNDGVALLKDNQPMQILVCIKDLQQKVEQLEGQLEEKTYLYNKLQTESKYAILQLENIIKEAIELIKKYQRKDEFLNLNEWQTRDLLNILNKGSEDK